MCHPCPPLTPSSHSHKEPPCHLEWLHLNYRKCNRHYGGGCWLLLSIVYGAALYIDLSMSMSMLMSIVCSTYGAHGIYYCTIHTEHRGISGFHSWNSPLRACLCWIPPFLPIYDTRSMWWFEEIFLQMWKAYVRFGTFAFEFPLCSSIHKCVRAICVGTNKNHSRQCRLVLFSSSSSPSPFLEKVCRLLGNDDTEKVNILLINNNNGNDDDNIIEL